MPASPIAAARGYAERGFPVFPCWPDSKAPLIEHGFHQASTDRFQLEEWWQRWPRAWIGMPTGRRSGFNVLDVDIKHPPVNGWETLTRMGKAILTPCAITPSKGTHLYFSVVETPFPTTVGRVGPGLDTRGEGGYVCLPPIGYHWHELHNFNTLPAAPTPSWAFPPKVERTVPAKRVKRTDGLSPYADAALDSACRNIMAAPHGEQEVTLNAECFSIGSLAGAGAVPESFALRVLLWAASRIPDYARPWRAGELENKVERAFRDGLSHPREVRNG